VTSLSLPSSLSKGRVHAAVVAPKVFASRVSGHLDLATVEELLRQLEAWRREAGPGLIAFHDLEQVTDYDSEARMRITPWSREHRAQFREVHVLVRSHAVAWGIRILSALTDGLIVAHHQRAAFEEALRTGL
jgi:hypothetical protein